MDEATFRKFCRLIYEKCGIRLGENKQALVHARIGKRMRALGMSEYKTYLKRATEDTTGEEIVQLLDAISTNVTSFFREADHFDFLRECFSEWLAQGQKRFRFWSAASSTGEEPYSLGMTLLEACGDRQVDMRILATDISTRVLDKCRAGMYAQKKLESVPAMLKGRYFEQIRGNGGVSYVVRKNLKDLVVFKRLNLSKPPFPMRGPLDVVFCRNVMIYFDNEVRKRLLADIRRLLKPNGYLMVGHAESLTTMVSDFKMVRPSVYVKI